MDKNWPTSELDPVRRLRVMAGAVHGTFADAVSEHRPEEVWSVLSDLQGELPYLIPDFRAAKVIGEPASTDAGDLRLQAIAFGYLGQRARFDITLESGWCWMESRYLLCGFAMTDEGGRTRYAFLGGVRPSWAVPVVRVLRWPGQLYARAVTRRIERRLDVRFPHPSA